MEFRGEFDFLSNFYPSPIVVDGWLFPTVEHAYQAAKSPFQEDWINIQQMTAGQAKRYGKKIRLRLDWQEQRLRIMFELVSLKFQQNPRLMHKLLATGDMEIIEHNTWGDTFWGVCGRKGDNNLGKILTFVRVLNSVEQKVGKS